MTVGPRREFGFDLIGLALFQSPGLCGKAEFLWSFFTVTVHFARMPFDAAAVITAFPVFFAVSTPLEDTLTTDFLLDFQTTFCSAPAGYTFAFRLTFSFCPIRIVLLLRMTFEAMGTDGFSTGLSVDGVSVEGVSGSEVRVSPWPEPSPER